MFSDPGMTNATVQMVLVEIDGDAEENANPQTQLGPGEFIETISVPLDELLAILKGTNYF